MQLHAYFLRGVLGRAMDAAGPDHVRRLRRLRVLLLEVKPATITRIGVKGSVGNRPRLKVLRTLAGRYLTSRLTQDEFVLLSESVPG